VIRPTKTKQQKNNQSIKQTTSIQTNVPFGKSYPDLVDEGFVVVPFLLETSPSGGETTVTLPLCRKVLSLGGEELSFSSSISSVLFTIRPMAG
jgi:hypothetical protein